MTTSLAFDVLARDRASGTFKYIGSTADNTESKLRKVGAGLKYATLGLVGGIGLATKGAYELAQGAAEDEVAAKKMALQFHNSADATNKQVAATERWITAQGKAYGVTDDELRPALSKLVAVTHDVTEARELASLAENVAAGRGKSLSTVTEALAKAQLGSLTGLSRLGVATKDQAGKTLTLKEVTADLAKTYDGQAAKAADTAAGRFGRLQVILSETGEAIGYKLLPYAADLGEWLLDEGVPAASQFSHWLQQTTGDAAEQAVTLGRDLLPSLRQGVEAVADFGAEVIETAGPIAHDLVPAVSDLVEQVSDGVRWFSDLPGPVKTVALEVGAAALIVPRLSSAFNGVTTSVGMNITQLRVWRAELASTEGRASALTSMTTKLGTAARTAAGVGGMVALTQSTSASDEVMQGLLRTAGLAATGFAVGGPIGAAVGGLAGAGWMLYDSLSADNKKMDELAHDTAVDYAAALDKVTGAVTELGREQIVQALQQDGIIADARAFGITTRDLVGATLGHAGAIKRVNAAYADADTLITGLTRNRIGDWIHEQSIDLNQARAAAKAAASGYTDWKHALEGIPRQVQVRLKNLNYKPSLDEWRDLNREIKLTPKQREIIIKAIGYDPAIKGAKDVGRALDDVGHKRGDLSNWKAGLMAGLSQGGQQVGEGVRGMSRTLNDGTRDGAKRAGSTATVGGRGVGSNLKAGILFGFAGTAAELAAAASSAVRQAVNAAKHEADIKSPSRVMRDEVGRMLPRGAAEGVEAETPTLTKAGQEMMRRLNEKIKAEGEALQHSLDSVTDRVQKWQDRLKSLMSARADFISGFQSFGSPIFGGDIPHQTTTDAEGNTTDQPLTVDQILAYAQTQQAKAASLNHDVRKLIRLGLSKKLIRQLQSQGAAGIEQIQALASGASAEDIAALNAMTNVTAGQLNQAGQASAHALGMDSKIDRAKDHKQAAVAIRKEMHELLEEWHRKHPDRDKILAQALNALPPELAKALKKELDRVAARAAGRK